MRKMLLNKSVYRIKDYDRETLGVGNRIKVLLEDTGELLLISPIQNIIKNSDGTIRIVTARSIYTDEVLEQEPEERECGVFFRGRITKVVDMKKGHKYEFLTVWNGFTISIMKSPVDDDKLRVVVNDVISFDRSLIHEGDTESECLQVAFNWIDKRIAELELAKAYLEKMQY